MFGVDLGSVVGWGLMGVDGGCLEICVVVDIITIYNIGVVSDRFMPFGIRDVVVLCVTAP